MDYSKWDLLEDEDDSDVQNELSSSLPDKLGALKATSDDLFIKAEKSCDPYDYKVALKQGYEILLSQLKASSPSLRYKNNTLWNQFEISCMMNCACCHLKLMDLNETIRICIDILIRYDRVLTLAQTLRVRYFRSYAYYKLNSVESLVLAENDAAVMTDILSSGFTDRNENVADYILHFEALQKRKNDLNRIENAIKLESECHTFLLADDLKTREGWCLYVKREFNLSCIWFAEELQKVLEEEENISLSKSSLLCNLYRGLAKSELALGRHFEVRCSFLSVLFVICDLILVSNYSANCAGCEGILCCCRPNKPHSRNEKFLCASGSPIL